MENTKEEKEDMGSNDMKYNGWTNYETWNVALWIGNECGSQSYWDERAQDAYNDAEAEQNFTRKERATLDLADILKDEHESAMYDMLKDSHTESSMWADLLGAALSEVNWYEIAEHMMDNVGEEETATADEPVSGQDQ